MPTEPRYERKFVVSGIDVSSVRDAILHHPAMFAEAYPPRQVNNIYLDTPLHANYADNLVGVGDRTKARVRWYGDLFRAVESPTLEFKIKRGLVGWKETFPLPGFSFGEGFDARGFVRWLRDVGLPPEASMRLGGTEPTLVNSYRRSYFATRGAAFRVTIDCDLCSHRIRRLTNRFLGHSTNHCDVIVELKYPVDLDTKAHRIAATFPFRIAKNSKYANGLEAVEPHLLVTG